MNTEGSGNSAAGHEEFDQLLEDFLALFEKIPDIISQNKDFPIDYFNILLKKYIKIHQENNNHYKSNANNKYKKNYINIIDSLHYFSNSLLEKNEIIQVVSSVYSVHSHRKINKINLQLKCWISLILKNSVESPLKKYIVSEREFNNINNTLLSIDKVIKSRLENEENLPSEYILKDTYKQCSEIKKLLIQRREKISEAEGQNSGNYSISTVENIQDQIEEKVNFNFDIFTKKSWGCFPQHYMMILSVLTIVGISLASMLINVYFNSYNIPLNASQIPLEQKLNIYLIILIIVPMMIYSPIVAARFLIKEYYDEQKVKIYLVSIFSMLTLMLGILCITESELFNIFNYFPHILIILLLILFSWILSMPNDDPYIFYGKLMTNILAMYSLTIGFIIIIATRTWGSNQIYSVNIKLFIFYVIYILCIYSIFSIFQKNNSIKNNLVKIGLMFIISIILVFFYNEKIISWNFNIQDHAQLFVKNADSDLVIYNNKTTCLDILLEYGDTYYAKKCGDKKDTETYLINKQDVLKIENYNEGITFYYKLKENPFKILEGNKLIPFIK